MTSKLKLLVTSTGVAALMVGANPAWAVGTEAGTDITNNVTVNFEVGGVAQTAETDSDTFTVDRRVNLTVAEVANATTTVSPGETNAVTTFTVTNTSNDVLDFRLTAANAAAAHGGTENFDVTNIRVFVDDGDGTFDAADDTETFIDELAADASATVFIVADVPGGQVTNDVAGVELTATAAIADGSGLPAGPPPGAGGDLGADLTETVGANTDGIDTVFADADNDGVESDLDDYTVLAAAISVLKSSVVIDDPINGTSDPKAIPGATVEYCISVANAPGSATATGISILDTIPANVTFIGGSVLVDGSAVIDNTDPAAPTQVCTGGVAGGGFNGTAVSGPLSDIPAGSNAALLFRVTVD